MMQFKSRKIYMKFEDILKIHEEYDAIPRFYLKPAVKGGVLKLPSNIIKMFPEREVIYEIDNNEILIYENKIKARSVSVQLNYAVVSTMIIDMKATCEKQGYSLDLCKVYNSEDEYIGKGEDVMIVLLKSLLTKESKKDEKLMQAVIDFMFNPETIDKIEPSIEEGFQFCYNYYMENIDND